MINIKNDEGSYQIDPTETVTNSYGDCDRCNDIVAMHSSGERDFLRVCAAAHAALGTEYAFTFGEFEAACIAASVVGTP